MKKIVITSGGTSEKIDNVRKITNSSTGKLGMKIAEEFLRQDEEILIYYICTNHSFRPIDERVKVIEIEGTTELKNEIERLLLNEKIDVFVNAMAVSDYMKNYVTTLEKLKNWLKNGEKGEKMAQNLEIIEDNKISSYEKDLVIVLKPTPKIISMIKTLSPSTFLVGFKLLDDVTDEKLLAAASDLRDKNDCDLVVANDLAKIKKGNHSAFIIDKNDNVEKCQGKNEIAKNLVNEIFAKLEEK